MSVRKLTADKVFTGTEMRDATVLVMDLTGKIVDLINRNDSGSEVECYSGILLPGFINTHCHLELSYLKGLIPEKTGMVDFLLNVLRKRNSVLPNDSTIQLADAEMVNAGIVAVGDICNTGDTISQKTKSKLYYHSFIETAGFIPSTAGRRFEQAEEVYDQFAKYFDRSNLSIVPHAPYSVSKRLFQLINRFRNRIGSIHNQEDQNENRFFLKGDGDFRRLYKELAIDISFFVPPKVTSLHYYLKFLSNYSSMILVHNVATTEEDLISVSAISDFKLFSWCLCPNANLYIGGNLPDIGLLKKFTDRIVIGTDSLASNNQLSVLEELKTIQKHFPNVLLPELLKWGTFNGARALEIDSMYGSFEKEKTPGVILMENVIGESLLDASCKRIV